MSTPLTIDEPRNQRRKPESFAKLKKSARKLFVERGYHATRPQDIAREAGLGHGTFYLHFPDKRACFLAFVEDARSELDDYLRSRVDQNSTLENFLATTISAIYDYSAEHPGVLNAAMTDEAVIDTEGVQAMPLLHRWGRDWAEVIRKAAAAISSVRRLSVPCIRQAAKAMPATASANRWWTISPVSLSAP